MSKDDTVPSLKGEEISASEPPSESYTEKGPGAPFPEGGWAGWATAIGACVQMPVSFAMTLDVPNDF